MTSRLRIVVSGLIAQHTHLGGVAWDYVQYVVGLARLGHDVYYIEDNGAWPYRLGPSSAGLDPTPADCRENAARLAAVMARFDLAGRWAYRCGIDGAWLGLDDAGREDVIRTADLVLNISGSLERPETFAGRARLVYLDSEPGFTQIAVALDRAPYAARIAMHDVHFSFGETIAPFAGEGPYQWRPTRQPIVLDAWPQVPPRRDVFTTVMSWAPYSGTTYRGRRYGEKGAEFQRFVELPSQVAPAVLELAMPSPQTRPRLDPALPGLSPAAAAYLTAESQPTLDRFLGHFGWRVVDSMTCGSDLDSYRDYILSSMAEWSVAKQGYVVSRSGWFSCRSACYLAAGRPVVVQDTGFSDILPTGEGLLAFTTLDEAAAAIQEVRADYVRHARAARALAEAYFEAGTVLSRLVDEAGSTPLGGLAPRDPLARPETER
jgi:hypothetical protein